MTRSRKAYLALGEAVSAAAERVHCRYRTRTSASPHPLSSISTRDEALLEEGLAVVQRAYADEERRQDTIEAKATTLLAGLGITATLLGAAGGVLLPQARQSIGSNWFLASLAVVYLLAVVLLGLSFWFALNAVRVTWSSRPDPGTFVELQHTSLINLRRHQIADLLVSYSRNLNINNENEKAANLKRGYFFLRLAGISLLLAAGLIAVYGLWLAMAQVQAQQFPTIVFRFHLW